MARKTTFTAPVKEYQATITEQPAEQVTEQKYYRFNAKMPYQFHDYLQEMAWRNRTTVTEYVNKLIQADMDAHPEWTDTIDILNTSKK